MWPHKGIPSGHNLPDRSTPRFSDVIVRKSGGLPHQSADWLAMTFLLFGHYAFLRQHLDKNADSGYSIDTEGATSRAAPPKNG